MPLVSLDGYRPNQVQYSALSRRVSAAISLLEDHGYVVRYPRRKGAESDPSTCRHGFSNRLTYIGPFGRELNDDPGCPDPGCQVPVQTQLALWEADQEV